MHSAWVLTDDCTSFSERRQRIPPNLVAPSRSVSNVLQFVLDMRLIYPVGSFRKSMSFEESFDPKR